MSIETENRQAIEASARYALLTGLLLLLWIVVTPFWAVPHLEEDLTSRSLRALHDEMTDSSGITLQVSGRSVEIVGPLDDTLRLQRARALVQNVWGVQGVSTRAVEPARTASAPRHESRRGSEIVSKEPIAAPQSESARAAEVAGESARTAAQPPAETALPAASTSETAAQAPSSTTPAAPLSSAGTAEADGSSAKPDTKPPEPAAVATPEPIQQSEAKPEPTGLPSPTVPGHLTEITGQQPPAATEQSAAQQGATPTSAPASTLDRKSTDAASPDATKPEPLTDPPGASATLAETPAVTTPAPEAPAMAGAQVQLSVPEGPSTLPGIARQPAPVSASAAGPGEEVVPEPGPDLGAVAEAADERALAPDSKATPLESKLGKARKPGHDAADGHSGTPSREGLLADWPRLARADNLQIDIGADSVRVSGEVDSLAERARILRQAPSYLPANGLEVNLSLVPRDSAQLAEYLNSLVIERFRFFGPGTRFAVGAELAMDRIAEVMNSYPHIRLGLVGFADPHPNPFVRRTIARYRAAAAYHALVVRGVDGRRLVMPHFPEPGSPVGAWYRPSQKDPHGQIQLFSLKGN